MAPYGNGCYDLIEVVELVKTGKVRMGVERFLLNKAMDAYHQTERVGWRTALQTGSDPVTTTGISKGDLMPVPDYKTYCKMIDRALEGKFAYPAINVSSLTMANAVLKGLAESKSDGIIQVSTGGGAFASGSSLKDTGPGGVSHDDT